MMALLLQLNGDLPQRFPGHERRLYLYTCRRKPCRRKEGSIRGFRATRIAKGTAARLYEQKKPAIEPAETPKPSIGLGTQLFGGPSTVPGSAGQNPFSSGSASASNPFATSSSAGPSSSPAPASDEDSQPSDTAVKADQLAETYASKLNLATSQTNGHVEEKPEPWPPSEGLAKAYTRYHLDADYEIMAATETADSASTAKVTEMEIDGESSGAAGSSTGADDKELFESSMDKTFQRFADRIRHNPEQILRYEFDGAPLLYSSTDMVGKRLHNHEQGNANGKITTSGAKGLPSCANCGARLKFELQLTPHAIDRLEVDEPAAAVLDGMDWGTIIFGVCEKDCAARGVEEGEVGYVEQWVGVQWEELAGQPGTSR